MCVDPGTCPVVEDVSSVDRSALFLVPNRLLTVIPNAERDLIVMAVECQGERRDMSAAS